MGFLPRPSDSPFIELGVRLITYIDFALAESQLQAEHHARSSTMASAAMHAVHNEIQDVSRREPAQVLDFLGSTVDTLSMEL